MSTADIAVIAALLIVILAPIAGIKAGVHLARTEYHARRKFVGAIAFVPFAIYLVLHHLKEVPFNHTISLEFLPVAAILGGLLIAIDTASGRPYIQMLAAALSISFALSGFAMAALLPSPLHLAAGLATGTSAALSAILVTCVLVKWGYFRVWAIVRSFVSGQRARNRNGHFLNKS
jgi:hypothetical protein